MTDLSFSHLHMTNRDMLIFDTFENPTTYLSGELSDEELEIPSHEIPPNPDDSDILPSQVHPSYPYGNPTSLKHPAARPRRPTDLSSRALFSDLSYAGGGVNGALRWRDLALDKLLPVNHEKEEATRAALARKMASGSSHTNHPAPARPQARPAQPEQQEDDEEEVDEGDEEEDEEDEEDEESDRTESVSGEDGEDEENDGEIDNSENVGFDWSAD